MIWIVSEFLIFALLVVTVVTQILIPAFRERPLFPIFRKRLVLEAAIAEVDEQISEDLLRQKLTEKVKEQRLSEEKSKTNKKK